MTNRDYKNYYQQVLDAINANYDYVLDELADLTVQFEKDLNRYQTDVYLYVKNGKPYLERFANVGGNSWLDDDGYIIYRDKEHYDRPIDSFDTIEDIAWAIDIPIEQLIEETAEDCECEMGDVDYSDVYHYARDAYEDEIEDVYYDLVDDQYSEIRESAQYVLDDVIEGLKRDIELCEDI